MSAEEVRQWFIRSEGALLFRGLDELGPANVIEGRQFGSETVTRSALMRHRDGQSIGWLSEPVPAMGEGAKCAVAYWHMGLGGPAFQEPVALFALRVNGRELLRFTEVHEDMVWEGEEGAVLGFFPERVEAAEPGRSLHLGPGLEDVGAAAFGIAYLRLPSAMAKEGERVRFEIVKAGPDECDRWVRVSRPGPLNWIDHRDAFPAVARGRGFARFHGRYVLFGDIHIHSGRGIKGHGCGLGSIEENYECARDVACLDFACVSDHDWQFEDEDAWDNLREITERYNSERFVTLHGYEWTSYNYGHRNVYSTSPELPLVPCWKRWENRLNTEEPDAPRPEDVWAALRRWGGPALTIPHHSSVPYFLLNAFDHYAEQYDRLIEIYSSWGFSEKDGWHATFVVQRMEGYDAVDFLDAGMKFGLMASSDGHDGFGGIGNATPRKHQHIYHYLGSGRTAAFCEEPAREGLFQSLYGRRCYALTGPRMLLWTELEGHMMGSVIPAALIKEPPLLTVHVRGTARLERAAIVKNGRHAAVFELHGVEESFEWRDAGFDPDAPSYYYVRIRQSDGEMAWSSPVWIEPGAKRAETGQ